MSLSTDDKEWAVRRWTPVDLPALSSFSIGGSKTYGVPSLVRKAANGFLGVQPAYGCHVAYLKEQPQTLIGAIVFERVGTQLYISAVGTVEPWRRQGVATLLKQGAVDYAGGEGAFSYYSEVHRSNRYMQWLNEEKFGLHGELDETRKYFIYGTEIVRAD